MTKKQITEVIEADWIVDMEGLSKEEACRYVESLPSGVFLDIVHDYDLTYGQLYTLREETDEEETAREAEEKRVEQAKRARDELRLQTEEERVSKLLLLRALSSAGDKVMAEYNEKHKGNPRVGDMCNLYKMILNLEIEGKSVTVLRECLDALERVE